MPSKIIWLMTAILACVSCGCDKEIDWSNPFASGKPKQAVRPQTPLPPAPVEAAGTISQYATLVSYVEVAASGYGVVVGLGKNGSTEVPARLEKYLTDFIYRKGKLGSSNEGTDIVSPMKFLRDPDTAVVFIGGMVPPCAPIGTRFDLYVSAVENTSTKSLDGGMLMPADLYISKDGTATPGGPGTWPLAEAAGEVLLNPFLTTEERGGNKVLKGRIPNGGIVVKNQPVRLLLSRPDYIIADTIQKRINDRFGENEKIANAANNYSIDITIPDHWRKDYQRLLNLIMHLPVHMSGPSSAESFAMKITEAMELPDAKFEDLSVVLEAIGPASLPSIKKKYTSTSPYVSFYCAKAGLRLGDLSTAYPIMVSFAKTVGSPLRLNAVQEMGCSKPFGDGVEVLTKLLDDPDDVIRVAACESLMAMGGFGQIRKVDIGEKFKVFEVNSSRNYMIWVSQSGTPRVYLFGPHMPLASNIFYNGYNDIVTINSVPDDPRVGVWRKIPRTGTISDELKCACKVLPLIETLCLRPDFDEKENIKGLNFTYGQAVSFLYDLTKTGNIKANFVLQPAVDLQTIYKTSSSTGRPD